MQDLRTDYYKAVYQAALANSRFAVDGRDIKLREARDLLRKLKLQPTKTK